MPTTMSTAGTTMQAIKRIFNRRFFDRGLIGLDGFVDMGAECRNPKSEVVLR